MNAQKSGIEKMILEEYENFVFQGYSTKEIAYMGTCLQRWAIEKRMGPANIKPYIEDVKVDDPFGRLVPNAVQNNPDFWKKLVRFEVDVILLMAMHGNLCLALRHPDNQGKVREMMIPFVNTPDALREIEQIEDLEGNPDLK